MTARKSEPKAIDIVKAPAKTEREQWKRYLNNIQSQWLSATSRKIEVK